MKSVTSKLIFVIGTLIIILGGIAMSIPHAAPGAVNALFQQPQHNLGDAPKALQSGEKLFTVGVTNYRISWKCNGGNNDFFEFFQGGISIGKSPKPCNSKGLQQFADEIKQTKNLPEEVRNMIDVAVKTILDGLN